MPALGRAHGGLPDDLLNVQYDPAACAVAVGWPGATAGGRAAQPDHDGDVLRFVPDPAGHPARIVTRIDGEAFPETGMSAAPVVHRRGAAQGRVKRATG